MQKYKNIFTKKSALYMLLPTMLIACNSRDKKISELGQEINRLDTEITNTKRAQEVAVSDSAHNSIMYMFLTTWIAEDAQHIDSLCMRNKDLTDQIQKAHNNQIAHRYPLSALLSKEEINEISVQLQEFHNEWNAKNAANIIAGRGTLLDLYNVCFDLDYTLFEPSFYIMNEDGCIRFDDWRDQICIEFEETKKEQEQQEIISAMRKRANQNEFVHNQHEIDEYNRKCVACDSVYMEIEKHFEKKFKPHLDSLNMAKNTAIEQRTRLLHQRAQEQK